MVLNETRQNLENDRISDEEMKECFRDVLGSDFGITIRDIKCHPINGAGPDVLFEVGLDGSKYDDDIENAVKSAYETATVYMRDYSDISEDRYEDLDPDTRDKKVIVIRFD